MLQNPPSPPRGAQRVRLPDKMPDTSFSSTPLSFFSRYYWARSSAAEEDQGCVAWGVSAPLVPYRRETLCLKQRWGGYTPSTTRRLVDGHPALFSGEGGPSHPPGLARTVGSEIGALASVGGPPASELAGRPLILN